MAKRFSKFLTAVGLLENFWSKASDKLWAGSVEISKTYKRKQRYMVKVCRNKTRFEGASRFRGSRVCDLHFHDAWSFRLRWKMK